MDLVRAGCVVAVILLHALMVGVTVGPERPVFANAGESGWWLTPVSWVVQVMPLFFVIGGFAGYVALHRRPQSSSGFAVERTHRLLRPAVVTVAVVGVLLGLLSAGSVPAEMVATAGYRFGQPLWFLAVFLLCQALLPVMVRLHERHAVTTLLALVAAAVAVDAAREISGLASVGFLNLAFVWLALQQLGFFLADGRIDALRRRMRMLVGAAATLLLAASFVFGIHSPDLVANLNPPTTALLLVGVVHTAAFSLLHRRISRFARRPAPSAFTAFVSRRTMTVYLWHMPVLLVMAGLLALWAMATGVSLREPASAEWWVTRPLWIAIAFALTIAVSLPLARIEAHRITPGAHDAVRSVLAVTIALLGVVLLLVHPTTPLTAAVAVTAWLVALRPPRPTDMPLIASTGRASLLPMAFRPAAQFRRSRFSGPVRVPRARLPRRPRASS